ncbi:LacI family transcriptional regulator [Neolewinella xylanilytica]|uniref:LacI family transcriptional regulator n=1 Tax=Neolewinella xylanilytica TaxID=1514080 RepID=A0A2S6I8D9_9BACT|nr:LacI family DNA-binding transcriptional regulator [Neolewinella xylanilytica]PPK87760.1 LacI family transcriptional regulator [Neolewinella xylanilytica]
MQHKKPTLNDIARKANVSIGTVDRAMNDRGRIAPEVKEKILSIADEIGYKKNIYASLLASKNKVKRLAYLLPKKGMDGYWDLVLEGIQKAIDHKPIETFVLEAVYFDLHDPRDFLRAVRELKDLRVEVILTAPIFHKEWPTLMGELARLRIPYVIINTFPEKVDANYLSYIGPDSYNSGKLAGRLMNYHCSPGAKVLMMPLEKEYANARHMVEKKNGFQEFFRQRNPSVEVITSDFADFEDQQAINRYMARTIEENPDLAGIYVSASRTYLIARALELLDRKPILIGYDVLPENVGHLRNESIHYLISQNPKLMGYLGMKACQEYSIYNTVRDKKILIPMDIIVPENYQENKGSYVLVESELLSMTEG